MEGKSDAVKSSIASEPGMLGPSNQSKLEVVKQEMARENVHILGIRKLKWTGMVKFNSGDH